MRYDDRVVDEVQSLNDIVEVISGYLPLKRSGRTFKALCPFHQEKTPSFNVHPEKQIFHCFGCGAGGNVFSFLMRYENVTFPEALRNLAERVHVQLPEPTRRSPEEVSETEGLYEVYRLAQEYYSSNLKHPEKGAAARQYLAKRGFGEEILEEFPLGWAGSEWRGLFEFLVRRGVKDKVIFPSGLVLRSREGNPYDLFRGRLLFPIFNVQGKVIAFGGRALGDETPKYLNSSESPIFRKRRELFGLHLAKRFITPAEPRVLIVEGYFDFLRVYRSGFQNVVATLGTSLTEEHVRVLRRYAQEAVVVFDGDPAGETAALRGLEIFLEGEMSVKVAVLPAGKDPDSLIGEKGAEEFRKYLNQAQDFFDFKWQYLTRRFRPGDSTGLLRISGEFLETFSKIKSPILVDKYLKQLAGQLGVGEASLRSELAKLRQKMRPREAGAPAEQPAQGSSLAQYPEEVFLLSLLLEEPAFFEKVQPLLSLEDFRHPGIREAFQVLTRCREEGRAASPSRLFNRLEDEGIKSFVAAHSLSDLAPPEREQGLWDCVKKIRQRRVGERLERLRQAIRAAEGGGQGERVKELLEEYRSLLTAKG